MQSGETPTRTDDWRASRVPVELVGESLLLFALVTAPWAYGAVEDSVRYALCSVVLVASFLFLWPDLRGGRIPRGAAIALAFPAFALVQVGFRQSVAPILTAEAALVGFSMAMVWAAVDARVGSASTNSGRRLAFALLLVCASESAFATFQWSTDRTSLFGEKSELQTTPFGSYVNHNNFAGLVSLAAPLAIAIAIGEVRRSGRLTPRGLALLGLACGLAIAVLASGSRGATVALTAGLAVLALLSRGLVRGRSRPRSLLPPLAGVVILSLAALAIPAQTRMRLVSFFDTAGSFNYRVDMAVASFRAFAERPLLGSGLGAFADAAAPFKTSHGDVRSERAEADLIEFVVEGGVVFIGALLIFGRFVWRSARAEMLHGRDRSGRWLRAGALSACATMLFHSLFDFGFRIPANALAFAILLGVASAEASKPQRWLSPLALSPVEASKPLTVPSTSSGTSALLVFMIIATLACAYRSLGAAGERAALKRTTPESRLDALLGLVDAHPYLDQARRQRGLAWMALAYNRGQYDASRLERARLDLQAVVSARPQWGEARADLGWVRYYSGQTAEACAEMLLASRLDPTHMGVGIAYAQVLAWSGDTAQAVAEVSRLRKINPGWSRTSAQDLASSWTRNPALLLGIP